MIGGEFDIDIHQKGPIKPFPQDVYCYASGRAALYQILKSIQGNRKIWLPDYLCHSVVEAVEKAGYDYVFYNLDDAFQATHEALELTGFSDGVVLLINYFGLLTLSETAMQIKEAWPEATVIEDDVQAYFSFAEEDNPYADYRFTSLRKTFAVPEGGLVKTNYPMPVVNGENTFAPVKLQAAMMKHNRGMDGIKDEDYLCLFEMGEDLIDENYDSVMSDESKALFTAIDVEQVKQRRKKNAAFLLQGLKLLGISPMIEVAKDKVPLFVPILLDNRDIVRKAMFQQEIFCPVHWPLEGLTVKTGARMAQHELSLIVDQRYGKEGMNQISDIIRNGL